MKWTVSFDPEKGSFQISGSSPGPIITPAYQRQADINARLGGKVLAAYSTANDAAQQIETHVLAAGFEPNDVVMTEQQLANLVGDVDNLGLWDERRPHVEQGDVLLASPWGF